MTAGYECIKQGGTQKIVTTILKVPEPAPLFPTPRIIIFRKCTVIKMVVIQESDGLPLLSSPSPDASSTSLDRLNEDYGPLPHEQETLAFCKQLLQNKLFVGHYQERRFVELMATYR